MIKTHRTKLYSFAARECLIVLVPFFILALVWRHLVMENTASEEGQASEKLEMEEVTSRFVVHRLENGEHLILGEDGTQLSVAKVLERLRTKDRELISSIVKAMRQSYDLAPSGAFFWECLPVTAATAQETPFLFVILDAPMLSKVTYDMHAFADRFESIPHYQQVGVISFTNLGKDATLVVPTPVANPSALKNYPQHMAHIASFHQDAHPDQVANLWQQIGDVFSNVLQEAERRGARDQKYWLSTSGLGVSWLHVRIDTRPKYYNYVPFKKA